MLHCQYDKFQKGRGTRVKTVSICGIGFMKRFTALLTCVILLIGLAACHKQKPEPSDPDNSEFTNTDPSGKVEDTKPVPVGYNLDEFDEALISYLCLNGYDSSNFLVSPAAFRTVLCLAASGAQGNTRTELVSAAGFSGMSSFDAWYSRLKRSTVFSVANSVWCDSGQLGGFTDSFISNLKRNYGANAYAYSSDTLTQAIHDWIHQKTDGAIPVIAENVAGASSVLVSTLPLQAAWENMFPGDTTHEGTFVDWSGTKHTVDFMEQTTKYLYAEDGGTKVLVIPMDGNLSFVCFLGARAGRFDKMAGLQEKTVHVVLPKFSLTSAFNATDLLGFLLSRGVNDAIDPRSANFYNMCKDADWFIQEILQKNSITVGEEGVGPITSSTKADPAGSVDEADIKEFIADQSFSFAIFSDFGLGSQNMLFYGQLMTVE